MAHCTIQATVLRSAFHTFPRVPRHYTLEFSHHTVPSAEGLPPSQLHTYLQICKEHKVLPFCTQEWSFDKQIGVFTPAKRSYNIPSLSGIASQLFEEIALQAHIPQAIELPPNFSGLSSVEFNRFRSEFLDSALQVYELKRAHLVVTTDQEYSGVTCSIWKSHDGYGLEYNEYRNHHDAHRAMEKWIGELQTMTAPKK